MKVKNKVGLVVLNWFVAILNGLKRESVVNIYHDK